MKHGQPVSEGGSDENLNGPIIGIEEAATHGKAAFRQGADAARRRINGVRGGIEYSREHVNDGLDLIKSISAALSDVVSHRPLAALAGAFLISYMTARVLGRSSS